MKALNDLGEYASRLDPQYGFKELPARVHLCVIALRKFASTEGLADEYRRCRELGDDPRRNPIRFTDPTSRCMVSLYWFFRHECSLSGDEAEVRVAKIRNTQWLDWVSTVGYIAEYDGVQNRGCEAVHAAVLRNR